MASPAAQPRRKAEGIPFYRNVKVIGLLAQIVFAVVVLLGLFVLYNNVTTALNRSSLPADFGFLDARAGIPIAESPIRYDTSDSYAKALWVGFLKTLRVALVGVVITSFLGLLVGVMRISPNWILRRIAAIYIETIRNTPLAVQIVFWYTAILIPIPPRISNPIELPLGGYLSNAGLALPWLFPTYAAAGWWPWLGGALAACVVLFVIRRRQIIRSDRPGNPWPLPLAAALLLAVVGYVVAWQGSSLPENVTTDFNPERGRGTVFVDEDGDGRFDANERFLPYAVARVRIEEAQLEEFTQNLTESRDFVYSTFRFPPIKDHEFESVEVAFADPDEAAERNLSIHFVNYPSSGLVYRDRDGDGEYDAGEEVEDLSEEGETRAAGFGGVRLVMSVEGFERRVVADRNGQIRIPGFEPLREGSEEAAGEGAGGVTSPAGLFGAPGGAGDDEEAALETDTVILASGPLVVSYPSLPTSNYNGGIALSVNYLALLLALVIYTASFIAEIVRGGIQAVPKGQREAAQALGLRPGQTFNLIIFPQALRIILPPMISQYLNLTKNSSLAPLAAYTELFAISIIIANQTGASVPVTVLVIVSYLLISLTFAFVLNIVNDRLAIVER